MDRETIKKAALNYVEQHYPANHPFKEHDVNVFMQGALYCINSVWHYGKTICEERRKALVLFKDGNAAVYKNLFDLWVEDLWGEVDKFAYMDDLVPDGKPTESAENFQRNSADFPRKFCECRKTSSDGRRQSNEMG